MRPNLQSCDQQHVRATLGLVDLEEREPTIRSLPSENLVSQHVMFSHPLYGVGYFKDANFIMVTVLV